MKELVVNELSKFVELSKKEISGLIETPPSSHLGDYSFPCFTVSKQYKKNPSEVSAELVKKISSKNFEKVESKGPYINFFLDRFKLARETLKKILKEGEGCGSSNKGKGKKVVIEFSSPNIAKPFGIGHLRSTIIGNSLSKISDYLGYKTVKMNYFGDWGTPFGKIISGYKDFGNKKELEKNPIKHLYEIYTKVSNNKDYEEKGRQVFRKLEEKDKETTKLWNLFKRYSLEEFKKIYKLLDVKFDELSCESEYNSQMEKTIKELEKRKLLKQSKGAQIVDLSRDNMGVVLIKKSDGSTLYATRDLTAAISRYKKYKFHKMIYEVGSEQNLYFSQIFKVLELLGNKWATNCHHVEHGLYLDKDGKKFATRKGKTIFMEEVLEDTKELAKKELKKRIKLSEKELERRALIIARAAIYYGDLKNHRSQNVIFDINRFLSFEGNTGPYLLYTLARSYSILRKTKSKIQIPNDFNLTDLEKSIILDLGNFPKVIEKAFSNFSPNLIANYAFNLSQKFNEFYHKEKVLNSEEEELRISLVQSFSHVLRSSLELLGIQTLDEM